MRTRESGPQTMHSGSQLGAVVGISLKWRREVARVTF
jgi:hypothetical protein